MGRRRAIGILLAGLLATAPGAAASARPSFVVTGWDAPSTTSFRAGWRTFERTTAYAGTAITVRLPFRTPGAAWNDPFAFAFARGRWQRRWFAAAAADLRAVRAQGSRLPRSSYLVVTANPGGIDPLDDAGWADVAQHLRIAGWLAHAGGLAGVILDLEAYTPPYAQLAPLERSNRGRSWAVLTAAYRQRGAQAMRALSADHPSIRILLYHLTGDLLAAPLDPTRGGPRMPALVGSSLGLAPAFLDGMLDAIPPQARLVDGEEQAYQYNHPSQFARAAAAGRSRGPLVVSPRNRARYRRQVEHAFPLYLDAYVLPSSDPLAMPGGRAVLPQTVHAAGAASDREVWVYAQEGGFWPRPGDASAPRPWAEQLPELDGLLRAASAGAPAPRVVGPRPLGPARVAVPRDWRALLARHRVRVAGGTLRARPGTAGGLGLWRSDGTRSTLAWRPGRAVIRGGGQTALYANVDVRPGQVLLVAARASDTGGVGAVVDIFWKDAAGTPFYDPLRRASLVSVVGRAARGPRDIVVAVRVPPGAAEASLDVGANGVHGAPGAVVVRSLRAALLPAAGTPG